MKANQIKEGKKVWYYPILGGSERKEAVITGGPYSMCGTTCCNIDILGAVVCIDNLEESESNMKEPLLKLNYAEYKEDEPVSLYDANGTWICDVGDCVEFAWIRIQIMRQQVAGCYIVFRGEKYEIGTDGRINNWPKGLFDKYVEYLVTICRGEEGIKHYEVRFNSNGKPA